MKFIKELFPPRTLTDAEAIAACGEAVVPFLHFRPNLKASEAAACVRVLRLVGGRQAERCLSGYLDDERTTVVNELAQAVNPLTLRAIRTALIRGEALPDAIRTQVTDLGPLAGLTALQSLDLHETRVTDLGPLAGLTASSPSTSSGTKVTDLGPLAGLTALQSLNLGHAPGN